MSKEKHINDLKDLLNDRAIKRGKFTLASGAESTYYIDCRKVTMCSLGVKVIGNAILSSLTERAPTVVCGPESAGIPIVSAVVVASDLVHDEPYNIEGCFVRKEIKDHGTKSPIEGYVPTKDDRVLVVEDVATTGDSLVKAINAILATGAVISEAVVLVDRLRGAKEKIQQLGIKYQALLTVKELGLE